MRDSASGGALTEVTFYILLALCEPRHGYAVMQFVSERTDGRLSLGAGTLYGALGTLEKRGWIRPCGGDARRREYVITPDGLAAAHAELARLRALAGTAEEILKVVSVNGEIPYFGPMLKAQAKWLNKMALRGWRLADTGKLDYSFIPCEPGAYQYAVDFVGNLSRAHGDDYAAFLSGFGYKTWFKNVNLQWSRGKVRWNPAGEPGARIISDRTNLDRELLIVERRAEPGEFRLYTSAEDEIEVLRDMRRRSLYPVLIFAALGVLALALGLTLVQSLACWVFVAIYAVPCAAYTLRIAHLKREEPPN